MCPTAGRKGGTNDCISQSGFFHNLVYCLEACDATGRGQHKQRLLGICAVRNVHGEEVRGQRWCQTGPDTPCLCWTHFVFKSPPC